MDRTEFQKRSVEEGRAAQDITERVLKGCGFKILSRNKMRKELGVTINFIAEDKQLRTWYFDVSGALSSDRAGLIRTDTVWKTLGRASVLSLNRVKPVIVLTTNLPRSGSVGDRAMRATKRQTFFDAIELMSTIDRLRLKAYAGGGSQDHPLPGYWEPAEVYGAKASKGNLLGASLTLPLETTGDPLGKIVSQVKIKGMPNRLKVMIPSLGRDGKSIPKHKRDKVLQHIEGLLAELGGGLTSSTAQGHWIDPFRGIAEEQVTVLEMYSARTPDTEFIKKIWLPILEDLDQEAVALVINDRMYQFERHASTSN